MTIIKLITFMKKVYKLKPKCKKKSSGHPKSFSDYQIALICLCMSLKGIHEFKAMVRYLRNHPKLKDVLGLDRVPHRTTLSRRGKTIHKKLREMIRSLGQHYSDSLLIRVLIASEDASLFETRGAKWHKRYRKLGIIPNGLRNVDKDSKWGFSKSRGWIQGYKGHFNVVYGWESDSLPFPVDAVVTTANVADLKKRENSFFRTTV